MEDLILSIIRSTPGEGWTVQELATTSSLHVAEVRQVLFDNPQAFVCVKNEWRLRE